MKYLLDTDWVIDHIRNLERVVQRVKELTPEGLALSVISLAELYEGVLNSTDPVSNEQTLQEFVSDIELVPIDEETYRIFGRERERMRRARRMIAEFDLLTDSTCLRHNLTLLSKNRRHFKSVEGLEIISISR